MESTLGFTLLVVLPGDTDGTGTLILKGVNLLDDRQLEFLAGPRSLLEEPDEVVVSG